MDRFRKNGIASGIAGGAVWGWAAMALNSMTGAFPFEGSFAHNLATFAFGGAVFGVVVAGFLILMGERLPFRSTLLKAVSVSASLWIILWTGGSMLSKMEPLRYHLITPQTVQGLFLAVVLGCILGLLAKREAARG